MGRTLNFFQRLLMLFLFISSFQKTKEKLSCRIQFIFLILAFLLQEASAPENRTLRPWIITMGHRPMYCSNDDGDDCTQYESVVSFKL